MVSVNHCRSKEYSLLLEFWSIEVLMKKFQTLVVLLLFVCFMPSSQAADPAVTPYSHTNTKGKTYYLFSKDVQRKNSKKVQTIYYFAKDPKNSKGKPLAKVPKDRMVSETKTGMLVLKKKPKVDKAEKETPKKEE